MLSPFKFLTSFTAADKNSFFGRQDETDDIYERFFRGNLLLLYGASGTGKTSILNCGLINKFTDSNVGARFADDKPTSKSAEVSYTNCLPINIRRGDNFLTSTLSEIKQRTKTPIAEGASLPAAIASLYLDYYKPLYLIYDQFEEIFTSGNEDEQVEFIKLLVALLDDSKENGSEEDVSYASPPADNVKIILVIREEYYGKLGMFEDKFPAIFDNRYRIEHMTKRRAEEVVIKTCGEYNIALENKDLKDPEQQKKNLAALICANSTKDGIIALPYLQGYLDRLYKNYVNGSMGDKVADVVFTPQLVNEIKDMDVIKAFLDEQIEAIKGDHTLAWETLRYFITREGTKSTVAVCQVHDEAVRRSDTALKDIDIIRQYFSALLQVKIIRPINDQTHTSDPDKDCYEITHDILAQKIWEKIRNDDRNILDAEDLVVKALKDYTQGRGELLDEKNLGYIELYLDKIKWSAENIAFIEKSKASIDQIKNEEIEDKLKEENRREREQAERDKMEFERRRSNIMVRSAVISIIVITLIALLAQMKTARESKLTQQALQATHIALMKEDTILKKYNILETSRLFGKANDFIKAHFFEAADSALNQILIIDSSVVMHDSVMKIKHKNILK